MPAGRDRASGNALQTPKIGDERMASDKHVDVMPAAKSTYANFLSLIKYSLPPILLITALVVWLIA